MKITRFRRKQSLWQKCKRKFFRKKNKKLPWIKFLVFSGILCFSGLFVYAAFFLPDVREADQLHFAESTIIYDRAALDKINQDPKADLTENILYTVHGDENRDYLPLSEISPWMVKATIAIEDDQFYHHFGFDIGAIIKAVLHQFGIGPARGGSTITQQLVVNTFLQREHTYSRKLKELLLAIKMEWYYSKDEILELYLNKIPYGSNAHGVEAAARTFFGKSARDLTLSESVILAGLPNAPSRYNPYGSNRELLMGYYDYEAETGERIWRKGRKDLVLKRMLDLKMISFKEFSNAFGNAQDAVFKRAQADIKAPHFVFYILEKLEGKYGKEFLRQGGLRIFTTIDPTLQEIAETTIAEKSKHYLDTYGASNVALLAIKNGTGEILSYVGGKDFNDTENDGQVDVLTSKRQPGSSFKPFVYAAAFLKQYAPSTVIWDVETDFGGNYKPQNFSGRFSGPVSARSALNQSLNIPAVKMAVLAGLKNVFTLARKAGIELSGDPKKNGVSIGLGVGEVTPLSHISAYQVFAGDGSYYEPTAILEIRNTSGKVLEKVDIESKKKPGIDSGVAALVRNILTDETTRPTTDGFDWNKLLQLEKYNNGAKTGTSNRIIKNPNFNKNLPINTKTNPETILTPSDSWTIGFTPHLVAGVWVGNNRGKPMAAGATGLTVAAPIWKKFMTDAHEQLVKEGADPQKEYDKSIPLVVRVVNKFSGKIATEKTPESLRVNGYFIKGRVPAALDDSVKTIEIDKISGRPATEFTPQFARVEKQVLQLSSLRPNAPSWQRPVDEWLNKHAKFLTSLGTIWDEVTEEEIEAESEEDSQSLDLVTRIAQLRDDVHNEFTQKNPPKLKILSPKNRGTIAPGIIEVKTSATSTFGIKSVEFYLDDQFITEKSKQPYSAKVTIPKTMKLGSTHTIKVIAIDKLLNYTQQEINVKLDQDRMGPSIIFLGPVGNQKIPINSEIEVLVDVVDKESSVQSVEFILDKKSLDTVDKPPYKTTLKIGGKLGRHFIRVKAVDTHGNISQKALPIIFDRERIQKNIKIPVIDKITSYRGSTSIDLIFPFPKSIESSTFTVKQGNRVLFQKKWTQLSKFKQLQIPKTVASGRVELRITTKLRGDDQVIQSPKKVVNF